MKDRVDHLKRKLFWFHLPSPFRVHTYTPQTFLLSLILSVLIMILFLHRDEQKAYSKKPQASLYNTNYSLQNSETMSVSLNTIAGGGSIADLVKINQLVTVIIITEDKRSALLLCLYVSRQQSSL